MVYQPPFGEIEARFCLRCAAPLTMQVRFGRERPVCPQCGWIFFADPKVAVMAVVLKGDRVLLVRRVNEPNRGMWSLPGGFMDAGEDPAAAVRRECLEETGLIIKVNHFYELIAGRTHPRGADLLLVYQAEVVSGNMQPGDDADQVDFFPIHDLPELAFESTGRILKRLASNDLSS